MAADDREPPPQVSRARRTKGVPFSRSREWFGICGIERTGPTNHGRATFACLRLSRAIRHGSHMVGHNLCSERRRALNAITSRRSTT